MPFDVTQKSGVSKCKYVVGRGKIKRTGKCAPKNGDRKRAWRKNTCQFEAAGLNHSSPRNPNLQWLLNARNILAVTFFDSNLIATNGKCVLWLLDNAIPLLSVDFYRPQQILYISLKFYRRVGSRQTQLAVKAFAWLKFVS